MSVEICAFIGTEVQNLESRFIQAFSDIGFRILIHPEMSLLDANPTGCLYLAVLDTPSTVERIAPDKPLLVGFGYQPLAGAKNRRNRQWPPRNVKQYTYEVHTRTSSGRSLSAYFMQALTAAILAKETDGYFFIYGDADAMSGDEGLKKILAELNCRNEANAKIQNVIGGLERFGSESEGLREVLRQGLTGEFDVNGYPFDSWPPISSNTPFVWPKPIGFPPSQQMPKKRRFKLSVYDLLIVIMVLTLVAVTIIYS
jgi:hypothetical protein